LVTVVTAVSVMGAAIWALLTTAVFVTSVLVKVGLRLALKVISTALSKLILPVQVSTSLATPAEPPEDCSDPLT